MSNHILQMYQTTASSYICEVILLALFGQIITFIWPADFILLHLSLQENGAPCNFEDIALRCILCTSTLLASLEMKIMGYAFSPQQSP